MTMKTDLKTATKNNTQNAQTTDTTNKKKETVFSKLSEVKSVDEIKQMLNDNTELTLIIPDSPKYKYNVTVRDIMSAMVYVASIVKENDCNHFEYCEDYAKATDKNNIALMYAAGFVKKLNALNGSYKVSPQMLSVKQVYESAFKLITDPTIATSPKDKATLENIQKIAQQHVSNIVKLCRESGLVIVENDVYKYRKNKTVNTSNTANTTNTNNNVFSTNKPPTQKTNFNSNTKQTQNNSYLGSVIDQLSELGKKLFGHLKPSETKTTNPVKQK